MTLVVLLRWPTKQIIDSTFNNLSHDILTINAAFFPAKNQMDGQLWQLERAEVYA